MRSKKVTFPGAYGDDLAARVDLPDDDTDDFVLFAHCFTCSKNLRPVEHISETLSQKEIGVFRFDFTGLGESEGDFADTNFSSNVDDLVAAAKYMKANFQAPDVLVGHSLGGAAVLHAAHRIANCKAVATVAAPADVEHVKTNFSAKLDEIQETGAATVTLQGRDFKIKKQFLDDLSTKRMDEIVRSLKRALMIFHSPIDERVSIDNAAHIYNMARHPKSFVSLDDADHLLLKKRDSRYVAEILASWARRYF